MHAPAAAQALRKLGHDVDAVAEEIEALDHWMRLGDVATRPAEDWLRRPRSAD
jgi:hypothetical protein